MKWIEQSIDEEVLVNAVGKIIARVTRAGQDWRLNCDLYVDRESAKAAAEHKLRSGRS